MSATVTRRKTTARPSKTGKAAKPAKASPLSLRNRPALSKLVRTAWESGRMGRVISRPEGVERLPKFELPGLRVGGLPAEATVYLDAPKKVLHVAVSLADGGDSFGGILPRTVQWHTLKQPQR